MTRLNTLSDEEEREKFEKFLKMSNVFGDANIMRLKEQK